MSSLRPSGRLHLSLAPPGRRFRGSGTTDSVVPKYFFKPYPCTTTTSATLVKYLSWHAQNCYPRHAHYSYPRHARSRPLLLPSTTSSKAMEELKVRWHLSGGHCHLASGCTTFVPGQKQVAERRPWRDGEGGKHRGREKGREVGGIAVGTNRGIMVPNLASLSYCCVPLPAWHPSPNLASFSQPRAPPSCRPSFLPASLPLPPSFLPTCLSTALSFLPPYLPLRRPLLPSHLPASPPSPTAAAPATTWAPCLRWRSARPRGRRGP